MVGVLFSGSGSSRTRTSQHENSVLGRCCCPSCLGTQPLATGSGFTSTPLQVNSSWENNSTASNGKYILSEGQVATQLTRDGSSWVTGNGQTTITFSFYRTNPGTAIFSNEGRGFSTFSSAQKNAAKLALGLWADVANVKFVEVTNPAQANIKFGNTTTGPAQAWAYYPSTYYPQGGSVWINPRQASNAQLNPGGYGLLTLIHEIGHSLGLSHPGAYNYTPGQSITYGASAEYYQDSWQYTVMSYFSETNTGANYRGSYAASPLLHDIAAIQSIYGAKTGVRSGDTIYGFNSNAGPASYNFKLNTRPVFAIYDSGGFNSLDCSGYSMANTIDLRSGNYSSIGGLVNNIVITSNTVLRRAVGGRSADTLIANDYGCTLEGFGGGDTYYGGTGSDWFRSSTGNNRFYFNGSWGNDKLDQNLAGSAQLNFDVDRSTLGFSRSTNDLLITRTGTSDLLRVTSYFLKTSAFSFADTVGNFTLQSANGTYTASSPPGFAGSLALKDATGLGNSSVSGTVILGVSSGSSRDRTTLAGVSA